MAEMGTSIMTTYAEYLAKGNNFNKNLLAPLKSRPKPHGADTARRRFQTETIALNEQKEAIRKNENIEKNISRRSKRIAAIGYSLGGVI